MASLALWLWFQRQAHLEIWNSQLPPSWEPSAYPGSGGKELLLPSWQGTSFVLQGPKSRQGAALLVLESGLSFGLILAALVKAGGASTKWHPLCCSPHAGLENRTFRSTLLQLFRGIRKVGSSALSCDWRYSYWSCVSLALGYSQCHSSGKAVL